MCVRARMCVFYSSHQYLVFILYRILSLKVSYFHLHFAKFCLCGGTQLYILFGHLVSRIYHIVECGSMMSCMVTTYEMIWCHTAVLSYTTMKTLDLISAVYMSWFQQNSPLLQRRGRRASSSSRDNSESRDESHRSTSPHARLKVQ